MKDIWFNASRILGVVLMLASLTLLGAGNPKMIPFFALFFLVVFIVVYLINKHASSKIHSSTSGSVFSSVFSYLGMIVFVAFLSMMGSGRKENLPFFALFFAAVFALVYVLVRASKRSARSSKSSTTLMTITQVIGLIIFIAVLSGMGLIHGILGYLAWLLVTIAIFGLIFLFVKGNQNHSQTTTQNPVIQKVVGVILAVLSVLLPYLFVKNSAVASFDDGNPVLASILIILAILVFIALIIMSVMMINKKGANSANVTLGYILIIVASLLPGLLVALTDKTYTGFAQAYFAALVAMILSFSALSLFSKDY